MAQQLTVTLPDDVAARVRERVAAGQHTDESAVIEDAIRELDDAWDPTGDPKFEAFLRREVLPAIEELDRDPSSAVSLEQVRRELAEDRLRMAAGRL
jgi:antitoxin ParD1/3/4